MKKPCDCFSLLILIVGCMAGNTSAFNHPEIEWKSVGTRHFRIHYYDQTEPAVYATWKIAEEAYEILAPLYEYAFVEKINITLADYDDYSNGWAAWTQRNIGVWIPDLAFELRGNTTWLRNVIVHELAHIMSMEKRKGMQLIDWNLMIDYQSPSLGITLTEPVPLQTFVPAWFAEGTAQMGAEKLSADCWDSRRDMALRCAVLGGRLLSLDAMGNFTHDWIGNEMVYNQGYSFVKYLAGRFGDKKMADIWSECRPKKFGGADFASIARAHFGTPLEALYRQWRDSLAAVYAAQAAANPATYPAMMRGGTLNTLPRLSRDGRLMGFFTNHKDESRRTDLVILPSNGEGKPVARIQYARVCWDFSADGRSVYYVKTRRPNRDGSFFNELYGCNISTGGETRLAESARVYAIACPPSGDRLCCVRYDKGIYAVETFSVSARRFETVIDGEAGSPFLHVCYAPSSADTVVVSRIVNGQADLFIVDVSRKTMSALLASPAQEESPFWGDDNRIYFSADYDGVFNIYSVRSDGTDLQRHSRALGGAFSPARAADGTLVISQYTAEGFVIARCPPASEPFEPPQNAACAFKPLPVPSGKVTIDAKEYNRKLLRPVWEILSVAQAMDTVDVLANAVAGTYGGNLQADLSTAFATSLVMARTDAVGKKAMYMGIAGQIMPVWMPNDTSSAGTLFNTTEAVRRPCASNAHAGFERMSELARPLKQRHEEQRRRAMMLPAVDEYAPRAALAAAAPPADSMRDSSLIPVPLLVPMLGMMSSRFSPTIGAQGQALMVLAKGGLFPYALIIDPSIEWRLGRDVYCGVSPEITIIPLALFAASGAGASLTAPLWVSWTNTGYYTQDLTYNLSGVTMLTGFAGPEILPVVRISNTTQNGRIVASDTTVAVKPFMVTGVDFMHGFPLWPYASLILATQDYFVFSATPHDDPMGALDGESGTYGMVSGQCRLTFPLVRNINRGRLYADNFYGNVFYSLSVYGNADYFGSPSLAAVVEPRADVSNAAVTHTVGIGIDLGFIKKFAFARLLSASAGYEFFNGAFQFSLRVM